MGMFLFALFLVLGIGVNADFKEDNGVFVLSDADFSDALERAFKPAYEEAAKHFKDNSNVILAKVDSTENKAVSTKYEVTGYPTVKLFRKGTPIDFNAGRDTDSLIAWINKKLKPPINNLNTVADVKEFIESGKVTLVGFLKSENADLTAILAKLADLDKASIGMSSSPDVLKEYGIDTDVKVTVFKKFDEPRVDFDGEMTKDALEKFLITESIPLIVDFDPQSSSEVFSSPVKTHAVFFSKQSDTYDAVKQLLRPIAKQYKGKMHFVLINVADGENARILEFFGLSESDLPSYRVIHLEDEMTKFKPEVNDLSDVVITKFLEDVLSGAAKPYFMSQEIPPESDDPVKVLVGKNFNEFVQDKSKAVFAFLHAPWCGHCKQLVPIWDDLGKQYQKRDDIAIVKMDATVNEAEGLKVNSFPTLKYYGKDTDEVVEYSGERTLEALSKFVESGGKAGSSAEPSEDEEKDNQRDEL